MTNITIDPTRASLAQLQAWPQDAPVVMLNLLRYREQAVYPEAAQVPPCSGREAYQRYGRVAQQQVAAVGGELLWLGAVQAQLIAPSDEQWDEVMLVRYPSVTAFLQMLSEPDYQAATVHRTAALANSRLIATQQKHP